MTHKVYNIVIKLDSSINNTCMYVSMYGRCMGEATRVMSNLKFTVHVYLNVVCHLYFAKVWIVFLCYNRISYIGLTRNVFRIGERSILSLDFPLTSLICAGISVNHKKCYITSRFFSHSG